MTLGTV